MTPIIVSILAVCLLLIATESKTNVNKAAVAIFAGTVGWVLYVGYGTDFVMSRHATDYVSFLDGAESTGILVKEFIARHVFLKHVGHASEIVLFLLATMTIVEILNNNGCFDFISQLLKTRSSKKILWRLAIVTFIISANLDNLTTTVMMLTILHKIIPSRRYRMIYGSAIVLAANCGGALTVIGDPMGLVLWSQGAVTPTNYSLSLLIPCLIAWALPTYWVGRMLPERMQTEWIVMPYRGDDTNLNVRQRLLMLFIGIGGLWFIPSFSNITRLSPFLGALCVLSVLWVVNELFNHRLMNEEQMIQRRTPRVLQYGVLQMMLFVMGIMLAVGVLQETGFLQRFTLLLDQGVQNVWMLGAVSALVSTILDNFATGMGMLSLHAVENVHASATLSAFAQDGEYWKIVGYTSAVAGNILAIGSMSGLALIKAERIRVVWYLRNIGWKALVGTMLGYLALYIFV